MGQFTNVDNVALFVYLRTQARHLAVVLWEKRIDFVIRIKLLLPHPLYSVSEPLPHKTRPAPRMYTCQTNAILASNNSPLAQETLKEVEIIILAKGRRKTAPHHLLHKAVEVVQILREGKVNCRWFPHLQLRRSVPGSRDVMQSIYSIPLPTPPS